MSCIFAITRINLGIPWRPCACYFHACYKRENLQNTSESRALPTKYHQRCFMPVKVMFHLLPRKPNSSPKEGNTNSRCPSYFALLIVGKSKCNAKASATQCNTTEKQVQRNGTQHNGTQHNGMQYKCHRKSECTRGVLHQKQPISPTYSTTNIWIKNKITS